MIRTWLGRCMVGILVCWLFICMLIIDFKSVKYGYGSVSSVVDNAKADEEQKTSPINALVDLPRLVNTDQINKISYHDSVNNPFLQFDKVYYINMDQRTDRRAQIENQLRLMSIPEDIWQRIPGVVASFGALGCSKAHASALQHAYNMQYKRILILEDDFVFRESKGRVYKTLNHVQNMHLQWDVLLLSASTFESSCSCIDELIRVYDAQTTAGYALNGEMIAILLQNVKDGIDQLSRYTESEHDYCIDIYWKRLQRKYKWYAIDPPLASQRQSFSDIEQRIVTYEDYIHRKVQNMEFEYLILVKTCAPRWHKEGQQYQALKKLSKEKPITFFYYYCIPDQKENFLINEEDRCITLNGSDNYLNLSHKVGQLMHCIVHVIRTNQNRFKNLKGCFFTDDDITIYTEHMYTFLENHSHIPYWGRVTKVVDGKSKHLQNKCQESRSLKNLLEEHYPSLLHIPIKVYDGVYCSGGGYYLHPYLLSKLHEASQYFIPFPCSEEQLKRYYNAETQCYENVYLFDDLHVGEALFEYKITPVDVPIQKIVHWDGI